MEDIEVEKQMSSMSRRSFVWGGVALVGLVVGRNWLISREDNNGVGYPFRRALEFNEAVSRRVFRRDRLAQSFDKSEAGEPRTNGMEGLADEVDPNLWRLKLVGAHGQSEPMEIDLQTIMSLPKHEIVTELKCIEGWSQVVHWTGARLADFIEKYPPKTVSGAAPDVKGKPEDLMPYIGIVTPDGGYYVGLELESALHEQTLLCYEMNGKPLSSDHGAPIRLAIPVKYGIKNIKRVGTLTYASAKPADYWAERGYDWYAGH